MKILRPASATWTGTVPTGAVPTGTDPGQLVGAAHAGGFSVSLSNLVEEARLDPVAIRTRAAVTLEQGGQGSTISRIDLVTRRHVPGLVDAGA